MGGDEGPCTKGGMGRGAEGRVRRAWGGRIGDMLKKPSPLPCAVLSGFGWPQAGAAAAAAPGLALTAAAAGLDARSREAAGTGQASERERDGAQTRRV